MSYPDSFILNCAEEISEFINRIEFLHLEAHEQKDLVEFIVNSLTYRNVDFEVLTRTIQELIVDYRDRCDEYEIRRFERALQLLSNGLMAKLEHIGAYAVDGVTFPYHFHQLLSDNSVLLRFDQNDVE